ncbi:hypothetical protein PbB2_01970 [Candidatus Phycosocius bacilliformis]|uniref:DUF2948 family protein n=1 Tax=Candidatus Phycosocius bacilliformis TaxID=1445552 RepID=A0A2P2EB49_9PROT|nr:DUF2948 family protein [Candidatus Phycosocius bacilliformis]GBF58297.1 hypothetical protein PbB2_01970 [Candidatus Phycosocius bacilliformis]
MVHAKLRLLAQDEADLPILSAAVQDGIFKVADATWTPAKRRFAIKLQRFVWEAPPRKGAGQRVWAVLSFEGILAVQARKVAQSRRDAFASLLAILFEPGEAPGGKLRLSLADGGEIVLEAECIDITLADLSEPREAVARPRHDL